MKKKGYPGGVKLKATKARAVAMQEFGTTNGVIYGESGEIVKNGLCVVCPHCGEIGLYHGHGGSVNIWTAGAIERRECTKCRKQFHTISLTVPADMTSEEFYLKIKEGVKL